MKTIKIDDATHRLLRMEAAKREMTMFDVTAKVVKEGTADIPGELVDILIGALIAEKAGCVKEDKSWYDEQIARAEAGYPDISELLRVLATEAGIE